jgi:hypothetical protein
MEKFFLLGLEQNIKMGETSRKLAEDKFDENIVINKYLAELA